LVRLGGGGMGVVLNRRLRVPEKKSDQVALPPDAGFQISKGQIRKVVKESVRKEGAGTIPAKKLLGS
jgi:hypothetical protein